LLYSNPSPLPGNANYRLDFFLALAFVVFFAAFFLLVFFAVGPDSIFLRRDSSASSFCRVTAKRNGSCFQDHHAQSAGPAAASPRAFSPVCQLIHLPQTFDTAVRNKRPAANQAMPGGFAAAGFTMACWTSSLQGTL
jgi:hypothetical protein